MAACARSLRHNLPADRRGHRRRPGARGAGRAGERLDLGSRPAARGRRHRRHPDRARPRRARGAAPLLGPHPGDGGARAVPRRRHRVRPAHRGRLLLRLPGGPPFTPEDLERIEAEMPEVAARDYPVRREVVDRAEANRRFADDPLKLERIGELGDDETITVYTDGPFVTSVAGPTSRDRPAQALQAAAPGRRLLAGDEGRQMLQRIYGTAWFKKEELDAYLHRLEESSKRDHRRLGQGAGPVHVPPVRRRARPSGPSAAPRCQRDQRVSSASCQRGDYRRSRRR